MPAVMERTYVAGATNSSLYYELESALISAGSLVVGSPEAATAILTIHNEDFRRRVLSVDSSGRASEYELRLRVAYSLGSADGSLPAKRDEVSLLRDYRFDPASVLSSGKEEEILREEMRRQAVRQILRRLQSGVTLPQ